MIINHNYKRIPLYCLIGNPVSHSLSSFIFNLAFEYLNYEAVYYSCFFKKASLAINFIRSMNVKGASITQPYKSSIMKYLDYVDKDAAKIGAVNTIINTEGRLFGYNFDYIGAIKALLKKIRVSNSKFVLIGAGGVAKSLGYGIKKCGGKITILNRTIERGKLLASDLGVNYCNFSELFDMEIDVLINATSIGISSDLDKLSYFDRISVFPMIVMDVVYNPIDTAFLKLALKNGCNVVTGLEMFLYQGALQFESWTNIKFPIKYIRKKLLNYLSG